MQSNWCLSATGLTWASLKDDEAIPDSTLPIGTMHRAKGLEFREVAVVECDKSVLPNQLALKDLEDPADVESVKDQERNLLYVACSRARERLRVSFVGEPSEFVAPLVAKA